MKVQFQELDDFKGLGRAVKLYDGKYEAVVTLDIGPRIMHVSLMGKENVLSDDSPLGEDLPDGTKWQIFGGHRVWHSPESFPRSYLSDSFPIEKLEKFEDGVRMYQKEEKWTQIVKSIELRFAGEYLEVINRLKNNGAWPIELAVWSLSLGATGGREVLPVVQRNCGLLPNTAYVLWPYSKMNDYRVHWGQRYIVIDNNTEDATAFKVGYANEAGWMAYFNRGQCFVKKFDYQKGKKYPDMGTNYQTYTCDFGIELESLSPLTILKPGKEVEYREKFYVFDCPTVPDLDEDNIEKMLQPMAKVMGVTLPLKELPAWDPNFEEEE